MFVYDCAKKTKTPILEGLATYTRIVLSEEDRRIAILTGYDQLAFVYIGRTISRWQVAMASFVGYAIANNVGFALLSGTSARYRFYSRWGLSGGDISRVVVFYSGTFWLGLIVLGSWSLLFSPMARISGLAPVWIMRAAGAL